MMCHRVMPIILPDDLSKCLSGIQMQSAKAQIAAVFPESCTAKSAILWPVLSIGCQIE